MAWLGEVETSVERLEGDGNPTLARLGDPQGEVRDRDGQFCSLANRGKEQMVLHVGVRYCAGEKDVTHNRN